MLRFVPLALLLLIPAAAAQETLDDLEAPHVHTGPNPKVWEVTVLQEESGEHRALVFRNPVGSPFRLQVFDVNGVEVYEQEGTGRGVQTLPPLEPGTYRFTVDRPSTFQVTERAFERNGLFNVSTTLDGEADAYILTPTRPYEVNFTGDVSVEWFDLTGSAETLTPPASRQPRVGGAYVLTVTGDEGADYGITLTPTQAASEENEAPFPPILTLVGLLVTASLMRRFK